MKRIIITSLLVLTLCFNLGFQVFADEPSEPDPNVVPSVLCITIIPGECLIVKKTVIVNPPDPVNPETPKPEMPGEFKVTPTRLPSPPNPIDVKFDPVAVKSYVEGSPWPVITFSEKICAPPDTPAGNYKVEFAFPISALNGYSENLGKQVIHINVGPGSRTLGFYKNHPCVVEQVMPDEGIQIGEIFVNDASSLKVRNSHLQRLMSQLLTTKLNVLVFGIGNLTLDKLGLKGKDSVYDIISQADQLIIAGPFDKDTLSEMQDLLDEINNSNLETPLPEWIANACA